MMKISKRDLRFQMLALREKVAPDCAWRWNAAIERTLFQSQRWREARSVMAYFSMPQEVGTAGILRAALEAGKRLALPRCVKGEDRFEAVEVRDLEKDLEPGSFRGIMEPRKELPIWNEEIFDLLLVPGVAFDRQGGRLGFGRGMYDRFLQPRGARGWRLALAYSLQITERIPTDSHDQTVHEILTQEGFLEVQGE